MHYTKIRTIDLHNVMSAWFICKNIWSTSLMNIWYAVVHGFGFCLTGEPIYTAINVAYTLPFLCALDLILSNTLIYMKVNYYVGKVPVDS